MIKYSRALRALVLAFAGLYEQECDRLIDQGEYSEALDAFDKAIALRERASRIAEGQPGE